MTTKAKPSPGKRRREDDEGEVREGVTGPSDEGKEEASWHCGNCGWPGHRKQTCKKFHVKKQEEVEKLQRQSATLREDNCQLREREGTALVALRVELKEEVKAELMKEVKAWEERRENEWRHDKEVIQGRLDAANREVVRMQSLVEAKSHIIHLLSK